MFGKKNLIKEIQNWSNRQWYIMMIHDRAFMQMYQGDLMRASKEAHT